MVALLLAASCLQAGLGRIDFPGGPFGPHASPRVHVEAGNPPAALIWYGISAASLGDLDGDGAGDFAVGAPFGHHMGGRGVVGVHSGRTGAPLLEVVGEGFLGWHLVGLGDVDGDGAGDFASDDGPARVVAHSGRTGLPLFQLRLETLDPTLGVARIWDPTDGGRDFDRDGAGDLLFPAAYGQDNAEGIHSEYGVLVVSGRSGEVIYSLKSNDYGFAAWFAGDLDADESEDVLMVSPLQCLSKCSLQVRVYAVSRSKDEVLWKCALPRLYSDARVRACALGDVNADSIPDVAVSVVCSSGQDPEPGRGTSPPGSAWIISGKDGALLHEVKAPKEKVSNPWDLFGYGLAAAGDQDGDGHPDLLVTAYEDHFRGLLQRGAVHVVSGASGQIVRTIKEPGSPGTGRESFEDFGASVASIVDVNDDAIPDFIVGAMHDWSGTWWPGVVHVLSGKNGRKLYSLH